MPRVSVIVPAYRPHNFERVLESIAANTDVDAEWIVVDDGSGPGFDDVFSTLPETVRVLRQPENRRQGAARNAGLAVARCAWIKFLDADDRLDDGHLAALLAAAREGNPAIPFARTRHVFSTGSTSINRSADDLPADPHAQFVRQLVRPFLSHCGALFPRDLLLRMGGYDESLVTDEDGDLLLRILREGYHFIAVDGVFYHYVHDAAESHVSADDDITKLASRIRTCDKIAAAYPAGMPPDVARALAQRMDKIAMAYWATFPAEARGLLARARAASPGYAPDLRAPLRILRRIGGPTLVLAASSVFRRLRGRPAGGAQG